MKSSAQPVPFVNWLLLGLTGASLLAGLAATAYAGTFSRFWADDYCYAAVFHRDGLVNGMLYWYQNGGNRFAAFLAVGLSEIFGPGAVRWLPTVLLVGWLAAAYFALTALTKLTGWRTPIGWRVVAGLGWVFFATYTSPDRLQTLYWRMGLLHYSLPLVLLLAQAAIVLRSAPHSTGRGGWLGAGLFGLLALFSAGLSETAAALQTALYLLALACLVGQKMSLRSRPAGLLGVGLAASLLTMLIMALSPSNAWRQALLPPPPSMAVWASAVIRYTADFVWDTLRTLPLPLAMWVGLCAALVWRFDPESAKGKSAGWAGWLLLAAGIIGTAAAIAPSAYAGLQYPAGRALMTARFPLLSGLGLAAAAWAIWLKNRLPFTVQRWGGAVALIVLVAVAVYAMRATQLPLREAQVLAVKAERWDARQAEILTQRAAGLQTIRVREVDVVSTLEDLTPQPEHWVNGCAADYYQVEQIIAER